MNYNYKVTASSMDGEQVVLEYFEDMAEAEEFQNSLLVESDDNIINSLPYSTLKVEFFIFTMGEWAVRSRKLLIK